MDPALRKMAEPATPRPRATDASYYEQSELWGEEHIQNQAHLEMRYAAIDALLPRSVRSVVEIGSGDGRVLDHLQANRPELQRAHGLDRSIQALSHQARPVVAGSVDELPLRVQGADAVLCLEVLEHLGHGTVRGDAPGDRPRGGPLGADHRAEPGEPATERRALPGMRLRVQPHAPPAVLRRRRDGPPRPRLPTGGAARGRPAERRLPTGAAPPARASGDRAPLGIPHVPPVQRPPRRIACRRRPSARPGGHRSAPPADWSAA